MGDLVFVSMPFGDDPDSPENEWTKLFEFGLKPLEGELEALPGGTEHKPVKLWRADRDLSSLALKTNVMAGIEGSTFVLGVLTRAVADGSHGLRLSNPNVLWELGYAEAMGKPRVIMADSPSLAELPVLAGRPNVYVYSHELVETVKSKDAAEVLRFIARGLIEHFAVAAKEARGGPIRRVRSRALVYPNRDAVNLAEMISKATWQVDILTTNLNYYQFGRFAGESHPVERALENGATVRIVTMDPESVIAEYRAKQLIRGQDIPGYRRELRVGIIDFFERFGDYPHFHLHIYNDLPLQITTRVDETIVTSIVTRGERARKRIQVQFDLYDEGVTESFVSHFQSMFDQSTDVAGMKWVVRTLPAADREGGGSS